MSAGYVIARENFKEAEKHVSADADPVMFNLLFGLQSLTNQIEADFAFLRAGLPTLLASPTKQKPKRKRLGGRLQKKPLGRRLDASNEFQIMRLPATQDVQLLVEAMFVLACSGEVNFLLSRPNVARIVCARPLASPVARRQSESDTMVTNMLHQTVRLEDQRGCEILQLLDGSRSFDELVDVICRDCARLEDGETLQTDREAVSRRLHQFLQTAAKLGLLIR